jgi:putative addiction module component (TIGR02574 family)
MNIANTLADIASLSVDERIRLVEAIWDSIASQPGQLELTTAQRNELERRLKEHLSAPQATIPWDEIKAQALSRARQ